MRLSIVPTLVGAACLTLSLAACSAQTLEQAASASARPSASTAASSPAIPAGFALLPPDDFSALDRVAAFTALHERVATDYAFTEWKGLDLDAMYRQALPEVRAAAAADDPRAYLVALRRYAAGFWDGHVRVAESTEGKPLTTRLTTQQSGGSVGMGLLRLDDGRVVVAAVAPEGPAAVAGIEPGAVVTAWNGLPIDEALAAVDVASLVDTPAIATTEYRDRERVRLLTRMPAGDSVQVEVEGGSAPIELTAIDDGGAGLHLVDLSPPLTPELEQSTLPTVRTLDGGVGYIQISWLADLNNLAEYPQAVADAVSKAVASFADAPGIVIDVRGNHGGSDQLTADICGHFTTTPAFFERTQMFDATSKDWVTITLDGRTLEPVDKTMVQPQQPSYDGPVVVLANNRTVSSGEGIVMCMLRTPHASSLGFGGTRASFGLANGEVPMPDGLVFHYPNGRSVDADGVIQLDSRDGAGGVQPTVRVPVTMDTALAIGRGDDVELAAALEQIRSRAAG